jgi:hypothetical protein
VNESVENIGARRLQTVMEKLLEEVSFDAEDRVGTTVTDGRGLVVGPRAPGRQRRPVEVHSEQSWQRLLNGRALLPFPPADRAAEGAQRQQGQQTPATAGIAAVTVQNSGGLTRTSYPSAR